MLADLEREQDELLKPSGVEDKINAVPTIDEIDFKLREDC
jgi:hypothetical protein